MYNILCVLSVLLAVLLTITDSLKDGLPQQHSIRERDLVLTPEDKVALEGGEVRLECSTNLSFETTWHFTSSITGESADIYYERVLLDRLKDRYEVDNRYGLYSLVIPKLDRGHAGKYTCNDNAGLTDIRASAELTVLELQPECTNIEISSEQLKCNFTSYGNLQPNITCQGKINVSETNGKGASSFSVQLNATSAKTCIVCFKTAESRHAGNQKCVYETSFAGIPTPTTTTVEDPSADRFVMIAETGSNKTVLIAALLSALALAVVVVVVVGGVVILRRRINRRDSSTADDAGTSDENLQQNTNIPDGAPAVVDNPERDSSSSQRPPSNRLKSSECGKLLS